MGFPLIRSIMARYTSISSRVVRSRLKAVWPDLEHIWLTDNRFELLTVKKLDALLEKDKTDSLQYKKKKGECEEFSLFLHAKVKMANMFDDNSKYSWAFGEVIGRKFLGFEQVHSANICLTKSGIYLIEPQTDAYWQADPDEDDVFFVKM